MNVLNHAKSKILIIFFLWLYLSKMYDCKIKSPLVKVRRQISRTFCDNGSHILVDNLCDGIVHCADGSDETVEKCSRIVCPYYLFQCSYGPCINRNKICDGVKDCADNSDENGKICTTTSSFCGPMKFQCKNNECIDVFLVCDGRKNCKDGSDETEESCKSTHCPSYLMKCKYGACVGKNARCNGVEECADGSDEFNCFKDNLKLDFKF